MKERELREHAECHYCEKKIGESQIPGFFTVEVVGYRFDPEAMRRQAGLGMMLNPALALAMGPDEDLAPEFQREKHTMCWECWSTKMPEATA